MPFEICLWLLNNSLSQCQTEDEKQHGETLITSADSWFISLFCIVRGRNVHTASSVDALIDSYVSLQNQHFGGLIFR